MTMMFYTLMMKSMELNNIDYQEFEIKLLKIYPHLSSKQAKNIIKWLFNYWEVIIDNLDKIER